jgi:alpha-L-fucosidase 2
MSPGGTTYEATQLNIESLWTGGSFADPTYNGGNKLPTEQSSMAEDMHGIRETIFKSPIGEIENIMRLATPAGAYGGMCAFYA